jgi:hypothetical protein
LRTTLEALILPVYTAPVAPPPPVSPANALLPRVTAMTALAVATLSPEVHDQIAASCEAFARLHRQAAATKRQPRPPERSPVCP